jgi:SAM-dependent methyltransferase
MDSFATHLRKHNEAYAARVRRDFANESGFNQDLGALQLGEYTELSFGCPGSTVDFGRPWVAVHPTMQGVAPQNLGKLYIPETTQPGKYLVAGDNWSSQLTVLPRYIEWAELPDLPVDFTVPISRWANSIEYQSAADYDAVSGADFVRRLPEDWHPIVTGLGIGTADKILDVGTGTGRLRLSLLKSGHRNVYGLDSSFDCLKRQAEWQALLGVPYVEAELVHEQEFRADNHAGTFAAICLSSALHHIADIRGFLSFASHLLRPGGYMVISAEPTNTQGFNALTVPDTKVDLLDVITGWQTDRKERTNSSVMFAEFWVGRGFGRERLAREAAAFGLEITDWSVWQWLGMMLNNHARNYLPATATDADRARFNDIYRRACDIDAEIKALMPEFAQRNFFQAIIVLRKK